MRHQNLAMKLDTKWPQFGSTVHVFVPLCLGRNFVPLCLCFIFKHTFQLHNKKIDILFSYVLVCRVQRFFEETLIDLLSY
jgi:hypothetical protein